MSEIDEDDSYAVDSLFIRLLLHWNQSAQSECVHECVSGREVSCIVECMVCELRNLT